MNFWDAIAKRIPLVLMVPPDPRIPVVMAEVFKTARGIVFAEPGFIDDWGGRTVHTIDGDIEGSCPWTIGDFVIRQIEDGEALATFWNRWSAHLDTPAGKKYSRDNIRRTLQTEGYLPPE